MADNRNNETSKYGGQRNDSVLETRPIQRNTRTGHSVVPTVNEGEELEFIAGSLSDHVERGEKNIIKPERPSDAILKEQMMKKRAAKDNMRKQMDNRPMTREEALEFQLAKEEAARRKTLHELELKKQAEELEKRRKALHEEALRKHIAEMNGAAKNKTQERMVFNSYEINSKPHINYDEFDQYMAGDYVEAEHENDEKALEAKQWLLENPDPGKPSKGASFSVKAGYWKYRFQAWIKRIQQDPIKAKKAYRILVLVLALLLSLHMVSCLNDIFGLGRSHNEKTIVIEEDDTTNQVIKKLDKAGLIKNSLYCKAFVKQTSGLRNGRKAEYIKGKYVLTPDMGLEKMLMTCQSVQKHDVIDISIPEGFTVEQIAEKLEKNKICSKDEFMKAANRSNYKSPYIKKIAGEKGRYNLLEGYLYPDTYELYIGEDADSVIKKMIGNFDKKWEELYSERAKELGLSVDEVVTLASIVQQEDSNPENMNKVASVFYNRLNSTAFQSLQSDTTTTYLKKNVKPNTGKKEYEKYKNRYDSYSCVGLPVGPICSPGADAIKAVLWPAQTGYYYFYHDSDGGIHLATTLEEQTNNIKRYKH